MKLSDYIFYYNQLGRFLKWSKIKSSNSAYEAGKEYVKSNHIYFPFLISNG